MLCWSKKKGYLSPGASPAVKAKWLEWCKKQGIRPITKRQVWEVTYLDETLTE